jgi:hypothetical protein
MSHNPYRGGLYDVLDTLGVMVWDENRDMGPSYVRARPPLQKHPAHPKTATANHHPYIQP